MFDSCSEKGMKIVYLYIHDCIYIYIYIVWFYDVKIINMTSVRKNYHIEDIYILHTFVCVCVVYVF